MNQFGRQPHTSAGVSLVEIIITTALVLIVFSGLIAGVRLMIFIVSNAQAEAGALAIATERLEYIRSLDYADAGTVGGVVDGPVPQTATSSLNEVTYTETISIQYFDRPEDGLATDSPPDTVPEDSKRVELSVSWVNRGETYSIDMQAHLSPPGLESLTGGTIIVNVFDADVDPIPGASVQVYNDSFSPIIDDTFVTDSNGRAVISGMRTGSSYQVFATLPGFSTDQTYVASSTNPVPNRPPISVATGTVSTLNFQIDALSDLTVETIGEPVKTVFTDTFAATGTVATSSQVSIGSSEVVLAGSVGSYAATGTVYASTTEPATLDSWESFDFNGTTSAATQLTVRVYEATGGTGASTTFTLIPDGVLPGNSTGFTQGPVNITAIDAATYPRLSLGATLSTTDANETPILYDWSLTSIDSEPSIGSIPFTLTGAKTIGVNGSSPVYKYQASHTTDGGGSVLIPDLEFDGYSFTLTTGAYSISEIIGGDPYEKQPGVDETVTLVLQSSVPYSLRLTVNDIYDNPIPGATVRLYDGGSYDTTQETSIYGQTYFSNSLASTSYQVDVSASGYDSLTQPIAVSGNMETIVQLVAASSGGGGTTTPPTPSTFLAGYDTRIPLSISGGTLFGSVTDFPVFVDLSDLPSSFFSAVQSTGADIRVTEADGQTEVPREVVTIDTGTETGEIHFKAPSLSISTTTTFYLYYGSSTASDYGVTATYGRDNVWTNGFRAVYHFEESATGSGTTGLYVDATGNGYDGDDNVDATGKDGKLGQGQEFNDAFDDYIALPYTTINGLRDITVSTWFKSGNTSNQHTIFSAANSSNTSNEHTIWIRGDTEDVELFSHGTSGREIFSVGNVFDDVWRHFVVMKDDATNRASLFVNGVENGDSPDADNVWTIDVDPGGLMIGQEQDSVGGGFQTGQELDGEIDEMRIADVVRSGGWIRNTYTNQNNASLFYTIGSVETE